MKKDTLNIQMHVLELLALIGKALSSPSRLHILDLLCQAERTVEGLAREASLSIANTSQHLQVLRQSGIVTSRREGNYVIYQVASNEIYLLWQTVQAIGSKQIAEIEKTVSAYFSKKHEMEMLDQDDIIRRASSGEILLLDVRPEEEYNHRHLSGAKSIPLPQLRKRFADLPKDKIIVAYCRGPYCVLSEEAVKFLRKKGLQAYRISSTISQLSSIPCNKSIE